MDSNSKKVVFHDFKKFKQDQEEKEKKKEEKKKEKKEEKEEEEEKERNTSSDEEFEYDELTAKSEAHKLYSNNLVFEERNQDFTDAAEEVDQNVETIKANPFAQDIDPPTYFESQRPYHVEKASKDEENKVYQDVVNKIQLSNTRRITMSQDPMYDFIILVAGFTNSDSEKFGAPIDTSKTSRSSSSSFRTSDVEPTIIESGTTTAPSTPAKPVVSTQTSAKKNTSSLSSGGKKITTTEGSYYIPTYKNNAERAADIEYRNKLGLHLTKFNTTPYQQTAYNNVLKMNQDEQDQLKNDSFVDIRNSYLAFLDKPTITGFGRLKEIVYANMEGAYDLVLDRNPHLANATLDDFIIDKQMRKVFARLVALEIANTRFLHSTRVQLDRNYTRIQNELNVRLNNLQNCTFNDEDKSFNFNRNLPLYRYPPGVTPNSQYAANNRIMGYSQSKNSKALRIGNNSINMFW
jgi:hypothetical protein